MSVEQIIFLIKQEIVWYDNLEQTSEKPLDQCFARRQKEAMKKLLEKVEG